MPKDQTKYIRLDETGTKHLIDLVKRDTQKKMTQGSNIAIDQDSISVIGFASNEDIDSLFD